MKLTVWRFLFRVSWVRAFPSRWEGLGEGLSGEEFLFFEGSVNYESVAQHYYFFQTVVDATPNLPESFSAQALP